MNTYMVLPDQFKPPKFEVRGGAPTPAVNRTTRISMKEDDYPRAIYTEQWQYFGADLLALQKYGKVLKSLTQIQKNDIIRAFGSLYGNKTAFNNFAGSDTCRNYVSGEIYAGNKPTKKGKRLRPEMKIDPLICAGNFIQGEPIFRWFSKTIVKVYGFDAKQPPPVATLDTLKDLRVLRANIINQDGSLQPFPQLKDGRPVPYPLVQSEPTYYFEEDLLFVE